MFWVFELELGISGVGNNIFLSIFGILFCIVIGCFRSWFNVGVWGLFCINGFVDLDVDGWLDKNGFIIGLGFLVSRFKFIKLEILLFKNVLGCFLCSGNWFWFGKLYGFKGCWIVLVWLKVLKFLVWVSFYGFWDCDIIVVGNVFFFF